ncbi:DUF805 domain-containing protein [Arthrobacter bambusae]|nr:DUF805 domain-containing protein [Arthrobacter bambusae]
MGPEAHRQRILLWENIFGLGTWHEPIDRATIYLPGVPKPPLPPRPQTVNPRPTSDTGAAGRAGAQGVAPSSVQAATKTEDLSRPLYGATLTAAYSRFWSKYATTSGRASRSEYWWAAFANLLIWLVLGLAGTSSGREGLNFFGVLYLLFIVAVFLPSIAVTVRRLHDANLSGGYFLLTLIPVVGVVMLAQLSNPEGARFDSRAAGRGANQSHPREMPDPIALKNDQPAQGTVSSPAVAATSPNRSRGLDQEVTATASDVSRGGAVALIVIALVIIGVFWVAAETQKPQTAAASGSATNDGQSAAIRAALQAAPDWHHYTDDVYFKWDLNPQCVSMLPCSGVDVETASTHSCPFGSVWLDLMRSGVVVDSRIGTFQSLSAGVPKLVQVYWNPGATGDRVQINHIACGT